MDKKHKRNQFITPILQWIKENKTTLEASKLHKKQPLLKRGLLTAKVEVAKGKEVAKEYVKGLAEIEKENPFIVPPEFDGKDYISMLLHIDAEIEHGLMLQYLYSAYSVGGPQIPEKYREKVRGWQEIILGIAKEEMGHFISVQNVLKIIGAPLNFDRESYPWDTPFYPFPFMLEKFSINSLAKYVYAEAPTEWLEGPDPLAKEIKDKVDADVKDPHTVGALFAILLQLINDPKVIPDKDFQPKTYPYQAKFDEWGRGYKNGDRGSESTGAFKGSPDVLVAPLLSRDDAYNALKAIAEQGEGESTDSAEISHFDRFLAIYKELKAILKEDAHFEPSYPVATNPVIGSAEKDGSPAEETISDDDDSPITHPETILWANLFNIRYRMLLNYLSHSFLLEAGNNNVIYPAPRGMIINSTFGEMYNIRSIANIIVRAPLTGNKRSKKTAGPPFTIPYTLNLPFGENNRWRLHKDLLIAAHNIIEELKSIPAQKDLIYLNSLQEADKKLMDVIEKLTDKIQA